jgi:hypothetical protein
VLVGGGFEDLVRGEVRDRDFRSGNCGPRRVCNAKKQAINVNFLILVVPPATMMDLVDFTTGKSDKTRRIQQLAQNFANVSGC